MNKTPFRVGILISGTGSNLKTLIDAKAAGRLDIEICRVISNRSHAPGLDHARKAGIPFSVFDVENTGKGPQQDLAIAERLRQDEVDLVILSGYMRIIGAGLVNPFSGRMINQHPSLLPLHPGLDTYRRALEAGDGEHGASVHFVTEELDAGPLISQVRIPVLPDDTPDTLAARLGPIEHKLLIATVELFTYDRVKMSPGHTLLDGKVLQRPLLMQSDNRFA
jgi:phosphoribosylglycinamide formyltransferase-1